VRVYLFSKAVAFAACMCQNTEEKPSMAMTMIVSNKKLLSTPSIPTDLSDVELTENARQVLVRRYVRRGDDGNPAETVEEMFWRVAYHIALAEEAYSGDIMGHAREFYQLLTSRKFFPNSPTFTGAGTPLGQLAACFVLPITDDMGRDPAGIFQSLRDAALIQQTGGGNGFSFSRLRPKGSLVKSSAGQATGPVGFLRVYDHAFGEIAQGGTRRGANMGVLRVDHPDIEEFVTCKTDENQIINFNISVGITDAFMQAVKDDSDWDLVFPDVTAPEYRGFSGTPEQARAKGIPLRTYRTVRAGDLFAKIINQAHHNGEPGLLFLDVANRSNPVPHLYPLEATNPCGEQWLGPYENCCLGSVNLAEHCGMDGQVDWDTLRRSVETATRFLDNVVDVNSYVPAVPQLKDAAHRARRIGLGIMGLADLMYHVGVRYGSPEGQEFGAQVMEFFRFHAMRTSVALARERGAFPSIKGSIYDFENMQWQPPKPVTPYQKEWGRPALDWDGILEGIQKYGIRNAAQTTVAPTGTIATVAGCEGYGCEPVFALAYVRHVNDNGKDLELTYASPRFDLALEKAGITGDARKVIIDRVRQQGTCQDIPEVPEFLRRIFVVAGDISAEEHIRLQAALQAFVDNSLSKTINFPENASPDDVANAYMLAWELGCKGITVYVTGSREKVVLETKATAQKKKLSGSPTGSGVSDVASNHTETVHTETVVLPFGNNVGGKSVSETEIATQLAAWHESKKPRPLLLPGSTFQVETPLGKAFITVNENGGKHPFEVFINTAKAGSETAAVSEAIGRLISYILRLASPIDPRERLAEVVRQLSGIGGGRSLGFGPNRVRSLPDGVGQVLDEYLNGRKKHQVTEADMHEETEPLKFNAQLYQSELDPSVRKMGDLCPECGEATMVNEEGCRKCYTCGYSEC
jgi:ribonucleoside-diphosphate reductase alpha chain